jgi:hypothetical protein
VDNNDAIRSENLTKKGGSLIKRNGLVFAFFFLLSFIFWYLNSLGKNLETSIKCPVTYANLPKNMELDKDLPPKLSFFMTGPGYSILRFKISGKTDPFVIDFSKVGYKHLTSVKSNNYYIVTSGLIADFNSSMKSSCRITSIKPDTLFFSFRQASE